MKITVLQIEKENMIDHVILTVSDFERSVAFYVKALRPLAITNFIDYEGKNGHPDLKSFGDGERAFFWLKKGSVRAPVQAVPSRRYSALAAWSPLARQNDALPRRR